MSTAYANNGIDDDRNGYIDDIRGWDTYDDDNDPIDEKGHGTHVAGIIAAVSNDKGVIGLSHKCKLMTIKAASSSGSFPNSATAEAVYYAVNNGAGVISNSYGGYGYSQLDQDAISYAAGNGVVFIAAAGNENTDKLHYPSSYEGAISVAATDVNDERAAFSNYGENVDVASPGVDILSTLRFNGYGNKSGTSMAAPLVSALAGLILSKNPDFTAEEVRNILINEVDEFGVDIPAPDKLIGKGRINAFKALQVGSLPSYTAEILSPTGGAIYLTQDIKGTANGTSFVAQIGEGYYPLSWDTIGTGVQDVGNYLATLDTTQYADGLYSIKLVVNSPEGQVSDKVHVVIDNMNVQEPNSMGYYGYGDIVNIAATFRYEPSEYMIEYSPDSNPFQWSSGGLSYAKKGNSVTGTWDTSLLPDYGRYIFRLTSVYNGVKSIAEEGIYLGNYQQGWPQIADSGIDRSSPMVADIDLDNNKEIIIGTTGGKVYVWHSDGSLYWSRDTGKIRSTVAVGSIDDDDELEIIVSDNKGNLHAFNHDGSCVGGKWPVKADATLSSSPVIFDINGDKKILIGTYYGIRMFNPDGTEYGGFTNNIEENVFSSPAYADIVKEIPGSEIVVQSTTGGTKPISYVYLLYCDGTVAWRKEFQGRIDVSPILGDINSDGNIEIMVATGGGIDTNAIYALNSQGNLLEGKWPITDSYIDYSPPLALADINSDKGLELLVVSSLSNRINAYNSQGKKLCNFRTSESSEYAGPSIGDINGDGKVDVIIGTYDYKIFAFNSDTSKLNKWPKDVNGRVYIVSSLDDIDNDGDIEVITATTKGIVYIYDLTAAYNQSRIEWPMFQHDLQHTGCYTPPGADVSSPRVAIISPENGRTYGPDITVTGTITDDKSQITSAVLTVDGGSAVNMAVQDGKFSRNLIGLVGGSHTITVTAKDTAGNIGSRTVTITVDATPPTVPIVTDDGDYTSSMTRLYASWSSNDPESGVVKYEYKITVDSKDGDIIQDWTDAGTAVSVTKADLSLQLGKTYYFSVKAENGAGIWSDLGYSDGIKVAADTTPPSGAIKINSDNKSTNSVDVTLNLSAMDMGDVTEMQFSNDGTDWSTAEAYAETKSWTLTSGDGEKTVYVKFKDAAGNWSDAISDSIILDTTAPITPTVTDDGDYTTSATQLHASWNSSDPESGIVKYEYKITVDSKDGDTIQDWTDAGTAISVTKADLSLQPGKMYYFSIKAINGAGTWSDLGYSDGIKVVDTTPPTGTIRIKGAPYTKSISVTLNLSATDTESDVTEMQFSNDGTDWSTAEAYAEAKDWTLTSGDGEKTVYAKFKDAAGNQSDAIRSRTIILDTTPPACTIKINNDAQYTDSRDVILDITVVETGSGGARMSFREDGSDVVDMVTSYVTSHSWTLTSSDGIKTIRVSAMDRAGNFSSASDSIILDTTAPISPTVTDDGDYTTSATQLRAAWSSSDPESGIVKYEYKITVDSKDGDIIQNWTDAGTAASVTKADLSLQPGKTYYFSVKAENGAGTWSDLGYSDGIKVTADTTPPTGTIRIKGAPYTKSISVTLNLSATDTDSGMGTGAEMMFSNDGIDWSTAEAYAETKSWTLTSGDGEKTVYVKFKDAAGNWSDAVRSRTIILDTTPPACTIKINNDAEYTNSTDVTLDITVVETGSGGAGMSFREDGSDVVDMVTSYVTSYSWMLTNGDGIKTIHVSASDRAGNHSSASDTIILDTTAPTTPTVTDDGDYTTSATQLRAAWSSSDPESGIVKYEYKITVDSKDGDIIQNWTDAGTAASVTKADLSLQPGKTYYFSVKAENGAGTWSDLGYSDGIKVTADTTPPTGTIRIKGAPYTKSISVTLNLSATDTDSGMGTGAEMMFSNDGIDWSTAEAYAETKSWTLTSGDGEKTVYVKFKDAAGNWSDAVRSRTIILDTTPPACTIKINNDAQYTDSRDVILDITVVETGSGGAGMSFREDGSDVVDMVTSYVTSYSWMLTNGDGIKTIHVSASDRAGNHSSASDTIILDTTAPAVPVVTDDGTYTAATTQLYASWTSSDLESGIAEYQYAIGTYKGAVNVAGWTSAGTDTSVTKTGLALVLGKTYYFSVKAKNGAGLWSSLGYSDGIKVDTTSPAVPAVIDDGVYTRDASRLHAHWYSKDSESGIAEYQYAIGTAENETGVVGWTSVGTATAVTKTGLSLMLGQTYYFSVKAKNRAGSWSEAGYSDGIKVDTTKAGTPVVTDDGAYTTDTTQLHASWTSLDPESGIAEYQYAIGTSKGSANIAGWTSAGTNTAITKTGLALILGKTYYFSVKVKNGTGLWSSVGYSDGIKVR